MREHETGPIIGIEPLTHDYAGQHAQRLAEIAAGIPFSTYSADDILREAVPEHVFHAKWLHSQVMTDRSQPMGLAIGWERLGDGSQNFPSNSVHLSVLACDPAYRGQGHGRRLFQHFLVQSLRRGYTYIDGELAFSLTTDADVQNEPVQRLYASYGFGIVGLKDTAEGRRNLVMRATAQDIAAVLT